MSNDARPEIAADPRVLAVAEWMRDREDGTTGWINTTPGHQAFLLREAADLLAIADQADPLRISVAQVFDPRQRYSMP